MTNYLLLALSVLLIFQSAHTVDFMNNPVQQFINLGYVLKPLKSFRVANANAHLLFAFTLPDQTPESMQNISVEPCAEIFRRSKNGSFAPDTCYAYVLNYKAMVQMKRRAEAHISHVIDLACLTRCKLILERNVRALHG